MNLSLQYQLQQSQWWTAQQLRAAQFRQLKTLITFCHGTVPFYREHWTALDVARLSPESWHAIPLLTRKALQEAGASLRSADELPAHGTRLPMRSSGSTGRPVEVMTTGLTNFFWQVFCVRDHIWHDRDFAAKLAAIRVLNNIDVPPGQGLRNENWGPATEGVMDTGPSVAFDIMADTSRQAAWLADENPAYLLSHPSTLLGLAQYCEQNAIRLPGLKQVRSIGETLPEQLREVCRRVWGVPLVDIYSCQEVGYLALQCPGHEHYHVQSENVLLEVLDDEGRECVPGQVGRVVITSLHNYATPLIRYEIGDYAEVGEPCPCGRGLPVLKRIAGRYRNLLTLPNGERRWPKLGYGRGLQGIAPIEQMQMIQQSLEDIDVRLAIPRPLSGEEMRQLTVFIQRNLGYPFRLAFECVERIDCGANGKIEQFISRV